MVFADTSGETPPRNPTTGIVGCCARAESATPMRAMNSAV
jgi:hypothetical protein